MAKSAKDYDDEEEEESEEEYNEGKIIPVRFNFKFYRFIS